MQRNRKSHKELLENRKHNINYNVFNIIFQKTFFLSTKNQSFEVLKEKESNIILIYIIIVQIKINDN